MLLAIDVGNTNTKFAIWDGQSWRAQWRASTDTTRTADEYIAARPSVGDDDEEATRVTGMDPAIAALIPRSFDKPAAPPAKPAPPAVTPAPPAGDPACAAATAYLTALHSAAEQPAPAIATLRAAYQNTALQKLVQASDAATARHDDAEVTAALATEGPGAFVAAEYAVHAALAQWMRHNLKRAAEAKDPGERAAA